MGNSSTVKIIGKANMGLWLTSRKILSITDVLNVRKIITNVVSRALLVNLHV